MSYSRTRLLDEPVPRKKLRECAATYKCRSAVRSDYNLTDQDQAAEQRRDGKLWLCQYLTAKWKTLLYDGHAFHHLRPLITLSITLIKIGMVDPKDEAYELRIPVSEMGDDTKPIHGIKSESAQDAADMMRLGKKQEFKRNFHAFSMLGLSSVLYVRFHAES